MKNSIACSTYSIRYPDKLTLVALILVVLPVVLQAKVLVFNNPGINYPLQDHNFQGISGMYEVKVGSFREFQQNRHQIAVSDTLPPPVPVVQDSLLVDEPDVLKEAADPDLSASDKLEGVSAITRDTVPEPRYVMTRSLILPGWGQVINKQTWKVPIIYGLLAGVVTYTIYAHDRYSGYRAAYYNSFPENTDFRFGPTPSYIPPDLPQELYRDNRDMFRNRRDISGVIFLLAYGLNVADAYIFAHLRDFDVSDDLSANFDVIPMPGYGSPQPVFTVRINF